jgi:hypothetical protein
MIARLAPRQGRDRPADRRMTSGKGFVHCEIFHFSHFIPNSPFTEVHSAFSFPPLAFPRIPRPPWPPGKIPVNPPRLDAARIIRPDVRLSHVPGQCPANRNYFLRVFVPAGKWKREAAHCGHATH